MLRLLRTTRSVFTPNQLKGEATYFGIQKSIHHSPILCSWDDSCEYEAFQSGHCSGTMSDVRMNIRQQLGLEPGYHTIPKCRGNLLKYTPKREDLPPRGMADSFTTAILPLSSMPVRERYVNHLGRVRMGRLMEELDLFAVWLCHRHVYLPKLPKGIPLPYIFVTFLVESVDFASQDLISAYEDIDICGHVSWTGTSSMETTIYIRQKLRTITKAILMMVGRNATNSGPAPVNVLTPANEKEQRCYEDSVKRIKRRLGRQSKCVLNVRPTKSDEQLMYEIFKRTKGTTMSLGERELPPNCSWMSESFQTTMLHAFPDHRNSHNHIFGGFVMRQAVEISFITACIHSERRPLLTCIMDVAFYSPLKVNSFLKITAYIVYTFKEYMQLLVVVQVIDGTTLQKMTTNMLHMTYKSKENVKEVLPQTYQETLWYISGRNKFNAVQKLKSKKIERLTKKENKNV